LLIGSLQNPKSTVEKANGEKSPKVAIRPEESISPVDLDGEIPATCALLAGYPENPETRRLAD
jgi:hypothetical protein